MYFEDAMERIRGKYPACDLDDTPIITRTFEKFPLEGRMADVPMWFGRCGGNQRVSEGEFDFTTGNAILFWNDCMLEIYKLLSGAWLISWAGSTEVSKYKPSLGLLTTAELLGAFGLVDKIGKPQGWHETCCVGKTFIRNGAYLAFPGPEWEWFDTCNVSLELTPQLALCIYLLAGMPVITV